MIVIAKKYDGKLYHRLKCSLFSNCTSEGTTNTKTPLNRNNIRELNKDLQFSNTGSSGQYIKTIIHVKQKPKLKIVFEPSWPKSRNRPPITKPRNT